MEEMENAEWRMMGRSAPASRAKRGISSTSAFASLAPGCRVGSRRPRPAGCHSAGFLSAWRFGCLALRAACDRVAPFASRLQAPSGGSDDPAMLLLPSISIPG